MHDVLIGAVDSYENHNAIRNFIETTFRAVKALEEIFDDSGKHRLVVVKPNWVQEAHALKPDIWEPVITHPSVILAVLETLAEKMRGEGTIAVCDAPSTYVDFDAILARGDLQEGFNRIRLRWPGLKLELIDLRREVWVLKEDVVVDRKPNPEDPRGYARLDLGRDSLFYDHPGEGKYYGADYDTAVVNEHHRGEKQEYLLAGTPLLCDLFVNLPKLKTHKKVGMTCCLKNLVGINGDKNWLPHYIKGTPKTGGDEFPSRGMSQAIEHYLKKYGQRMALNLPVAGTWLYRKMRKAGVSVLGDSEKVIRNGNWGGNDTCWRMVLDLNRALLYGNMDGSWNHAAGRKRYLAIVDGIVGGQGNGPLCPDPAKSGVLISGTNPATVDAVAARLMGYDPMHIPVIGNAFSPHRWQIANVELKDIRVTDGRCGETVPISSLRLAIEGGFRPHFGWLNLVEGK